MFTAYSTQGQLKPRLILAEGFWYGLIQAAAYLGRESVRINALKRPRLAEAVNDCCACSVFNHIPDLKSQTFPAEGRASQWRENEFCLHLQRRKWRIEIPVKKKKCVECPRRNTNPAHMQRA